jgi:type 2 lantibiotic biosynthesis protein LanM
MASPSPDPAIPENGESLYERLTISGSPQGIDLDSSDFKSWCEVFSASREMFAKRLDSLGITVEQAQEISARRRCSVGTPIWYTTLLNAINYPAEVIDPLPDHPFATLWWPAVAYAEHQLLSDLELDERWPRAVWHPLSGHLLKEICSTAAEPTYQIFAQHRSAGGSFRGFVRLTRSAEYANIFGQFPALGRCIAMLLSSWIETTRTLFNRLQADADEIWSSFGIPRERRIRSVEAGLSDRHEGGFQAILLEFDNLVRVVYKPKDMSLEATLPSINEWLAGQGCPIRFRFPNCVNKGSYGWSEFIPQRGCTEKEEIHRYFYQAGALLCLAYMLNARDLLIDNLVACGADPVPIDLETFFQAEMQSAPNYGKPPASELPEDRQRSSVMDTGMLPVWQVSGVDTACDLSGLCGTKELIPGITRLCWQHVNSDEMKPHYEPVTHPASKNLPSYRGIHLKADDYLQEVVHGFSDIHAFLISHKESFLNHLDLYSTVRGRVIFRSTTVYSRLIKESVHPSALVSGVKRSLVFERLFRPPLRNGSLSLPLKRLLDSEIESLTFLDIPRFYCELGRETLQLQHGGMLPHALWEAPVTTVKRRVKNSSSRTLEYHLENIRAALEKKPRYNVPTDTTEQLTALANEYAEEITSRAESRPERFLWELPSFCPPDAIPPIDRLGIYNGDLGILIFLTAAGKASQQPSTQGLLDRFLQRWREFAPETGMSLGICNGIGSLIYGGILLNRLTGDQRWAEFATRIATHISATMVRDCAEPELTFGIAGLLVALANLYDLTKEKRWLTIGQLGAEVLAERFSQDEGWKRPNGECALGLAHGSAGIAFAGLRFAQVTNGELGIHLAQRAFAFDRRFYSAEAHNWPVLISSPSRYMRTWCAGLPGILLARATGWQLTRDPNLYSEIEENFLHFDSTLAGTDHWCCGNLGNAEILSYLGEVLNRHNEHGRKLLRKTIDRALQSVFYRFCPSLGDNYCFQPSLFRGLAGVGYTLLRFAKPKLLPFILGFES